MVIVVASDEELVEVIVVANVVEWNVAVADIVVAAAEAENVVVVDIAVVVAAAGNGALAAMEQVDHGQWYFEQCRYCLQPEDGGPGNSEVGMW